MRRESDAKSGKNRGKRKEREKEKRLEEKDGKEFMKITRNYNELSLA